MPGFGVFSPGECCCPDPPRLCVLAMGCGKLVEIPLVFPPQASHSGFLVGALVTVKDSQGNVVGSGATDENGMFCIDHPGAGTYTADVGYPPYHQDGSVTKTIGEIGDTMPVALDMADGYVCCPISGCADENGDVLPMPTVLHATDGNGTTELHHEGDPEAGGSWYGETGVHVFCYATGEFVSIKICYRLSCPPTTITRSCAPCEHPDNCSYTPGGPFGGEPAYTDAFGSNSPGSCPPAYANVYSRTTARCPGGLSITVSA